MTAAGITARMLDCLERQERWFSGLIAALEAAGPEGADEQAFLEEQRKNARATQALEAEFRALLKEWETATDTPEAEGGRVRERAAHVEAVARRLEALYQARAATVNERLAGVRQSLNELKRGRAVAGKYHLRRPADASRLDKKS